jgi:hypothetical protein
MIPRTASNGATETEYNWGIYSIIGGEERTENEAKGGMRRQKEQEGEEQERRETEKRQREREKWKEYKGKEEKRERKWEKR